jgi:hypothetical protein
VKISAQQLRTFNAWATVVWLVLVIPSVLFWSQSILWVVLMSAYAIVATHFAGWAGARAEVEAKRGNDDRSVR